MDKIAVTCGHYDAYRKGVKFEGTLEFYVPLAEVNNNSKNQCFKELYPLFEEAFNSNLPPHEWYNKNISNLF